jgi:ParB family chromosome partitioning protein
MGMSERRPEKRRGLGRGLGSLIPTHEPGAEDGLAARAAAATDPALGLAAVAGAYFAELPVAAIAPNARQPRQVFDTDAMAELVHSVREIGLLQPVVVR